LATWAEFEAAAPRLASRGKALLYQYGPPLGFLATVRRDGGPRVHPFCPVVAEGGMWAYILRHSPKGADLRRDPRFALHAFAPKEVDDEFFVRGQAEPTSPRAELRSAIVAAAAPATVGGEDEQLFQLHLDRVLLATYERRGQWPPRYERWSDAELTNRAGPPTGYRSVTPRMVVANALAQVEFLRAVFGAVGEVHVGRPAEMRIGDSLVMVSSAAEREPHPAFLYVYVDDADRCYRRALEAGAVSLEEPFDAPYGDRRAMVRDPFGNVFQIAQRLAPAGG